MKKAYVQQKLELALSNSGTKTLGKTLPFKCYYTSPLPSTRWKLTNCGTKKKKASLTIHKMWTFLPESPASRAVSVQELSPALHNAAFILVYFAIFPPDSKRAVLDRTCFSGQFHLSRGMWRTVKLFSSHYKRSVEEQRTNNVRSGTKNFLIVFQSYKHILAGGFKAQRCLKKKKKK